MIWCPSAAILLANFFGGWEIFLLLAIAVILYGARRLPELRNGSRTRRAADKDTTSEALPGARSAVDQWILWLAQGLDVGRVPLAPGTFGSLVGLLWFAVLLAPGSLAIYLAGMLAGFVVSVWCCGRAERILGQTDPGSIVLDEIVALPACFLPWVLHARAALHSMPPVATFFSGHAWIWSAGVFVLFRFFDVVKPWPVRQIQRLPGGWGVTADDLLAALYVAGVVWLTLIGTATASPRA